ncbi:MAG TPA: aminopeptidase N [Burkholderiales bacterium]|nr:aminopeptidase N [Burkholderiales bacterium]
MREPQPNSIHLKDYAPPAFLVDAIELDVDIRAEDAVVRTVLTLRRNPQAATPRAPLVLDGEALELVSLALDGVELRAGAYSLTPTLLEVAHLPDACRLETVSRIVPQRNTTLEGLYATKTGFVTQCEAEGFRRITWFPDRPDVMARYVTTIHADKAKYPVLLSNGNRVAAGDETGGRHWARFEDPFPKPSYLFALVAAKLDALEDSFVTRAGKRAELAVYVEPGKLDQATWAMDCLKRAMRWDEARFGLELDLDHYKIVAVGDFNSGAMENKGLNIFNTRFVLARPDVATDTDYFNIDRVVAHEYFHNWTGNRVTCRDWFQLSLKEGLTVFRDQEYGADSYSRAVIRIQEVRMLRAAQFPEDAGPMAHPVRPQSYVEIRNFYTLTVYEKGAELVRMQHTLLGEERFQAGMRLYFERHDGQAVTCDDFVQAMQDASGVDLGQFKRWYDVAGTPVLDCAGTYDAAAKRFTLRVGQSMNPPFHIPLAVGLVGPAGEELLPEGTRVLSVHEPEAAFVFDDVPAKPVPSLLRGFSAPVILKYDYSEQDLVHLMARDRDPFNRWEAGQRLATTIILERGGEPSPAYLEASARVLATGAEDPAFAAEALAVPAESFLAEQLAEVDPDALHAARNRLRRAIAESLKERLLEVYRANAVEGPFRPDAASAGRRALRNAALSLLMELATVDIRALCYEQYAQSDNMTESFAALGMLASCDCIERDKALDSFYARWKDESLVVDKWLAVQATSRLPDTLARVRGLLAHPAFDLKVPNKVYALIRSFSANHVRFHAADGGGYAFLADQVIALNALNPQVAARMARGFDRWKKFDAARRAQAQAQLERIRDAEGLSRDVAEIVHKALD